jgi:hypothetical protein
MSKFSRIAGLIPVLLAAAAAACGRTEIGGTGPVIEVALTPETAALRAGDSVPLLANAKTDAGSRSRVRWQSRAPSILRLDTTALMGNRVWARAIAPGVAPVTVTVEPSASTQGGSLQLEATVTVLPR